MLDGGSVEEPDHDIACRDVPLHDAGAADFDGDGKSDVLWRNTATGDVAIWYMDGMTIRASSGFVTSLTDLNWTAVAPR